MCMFLCVYAYVHVYVVSLDEMMVTLTVKMVKMPKSYPFSKPLASTSLSNRNLSLQPQGENNPAVEGDSPSMKRVGAGSFRKEQTSTQRGAWKEGLGYL